MTNNNRITQILLGAIAALLLTTVLILMFKGDRGEVQTTAAAPTTVTPMPLESAPTAVIESVQPSTPEVAKMSAKEVQDMLDNAEEEPRATKEEIVPFNQLEGEDPAPSEYVYVGSATVSCADGKGRSISCQEVAKRVPMLPPEAVKNHYCEAGVCMERGRCERIIGADPLYANPKKFGIDDWGSYSIENYPGNVPGMTCD